MLRSIDSLVAHPISEITSPIEIMSGLNTSILS